MDGGGGLQALPRRSLAIRSSHALPRSSPLHRAPRQRRMARAGVAAAALALLLAGLCAASDAPLEVVLVGLSNRRVRRPGAPPSGPLGCPPSSLPRPASPARRMCNAQAGQLLEGARGRAKGCSAPPRRRLAPRRRAVIACAPAPAPAPASARGFAHPPLPLHPRRQGGAGRQRWPAPGGQPRRLLRRLQATPRLQRVDVVLRARRRVAPLLVPRWVLGAGGSAAEDQCHRAGSAASTTPPPPGCRLRLWGQAPRVHPETGGG